MHSAIYEPYAVKWGCIDLWSMSEEGGGVSLPWGYGHSSIC